MDVVDYRNATSGVTVDLGRSTAQSTGFDTATLVNIEGINGSDYDDVITGNSGDNQFEGRGGNDTFNIGSGGHDTLLYKLINASDATGGNGSDVVNGFTVGTGKGRRIRTVSTCATCFPTAVIPAPARRATSTAWRRWTAARATSPTTSAWCRTAATPRSGLTGRHRRSVLAHHAGDAERGADRSGDAAGEPPAVNCVKHCRGERSSRLLRFFNELH